jgi:hypothetical protein
MTKIDLYNNYYDDVPAGEVGYPKIVYWRHPEDGQPRQRILRNKSESDCFFDWFLSKNPNIDFQIE